MSHIIKIRQPSKSANLTSIQLFLLAAFDDYLSARVLIRYQQLVQAAVLASTAIEKYCKAILAFRGNSSSGHLKNEHWNCLKNFDPGLYSTFNEKFFMFLQKCYELRYPDALPDGYNLVIRSRELLAELDHTAISIEEKFSASRKNTEQKNLFKILQVKNDERLIWNNHKLNKEDRFAFIARDNQHVYECRMIAGSLVHFSYITLPMASDGNFMREGLIPAGNDGRSFTVSSEPGMEKIVDAVCEKCGKAWNERLLLQHKLVKFLDHAPAAHFGLERDADTGEVLRVLSSICENCEPEKIAEVIKRAAVTAGLSPSPPIGR
ncbi:MAG: hypothetical protein ABSC60_11085 [Acidobacteriota bacterium]|jgi:hypothetical protein